MFLFGVIFWNSFFHLLLSFKPAWLFVINYTNWDKKLEETYQLSGLILGGNNKNKNNKTNKE